MNNPHPWAQFNPRANPRPWDGRTKLIVKRERVHLYCEKKPVFVLTLECGHTMKMPPSAPRDLGDAICMVCPGWDTGKE